MAGLIDLVRDGDIPRDSHRALRPPRRPAGAQRLLRAVHHDPAGCPMSDARSTSRTSSSGPPAPRPSTGPTVGDRPVAGTASREDAWAAFDRAAARGPDAGGAGRRRAARGGRGTPGRHGRPALLRLRRRRLARRPPTAADMLAVGLGPERLQPACCRRPPRRPSAPPAAGSRTCSGSRRGASVGFVTGAQAANTVGLACGRHQVLEQAGYDVESDGLIGAPRVRVVAGFERHATIDRSLRLLGLGTASLVPVLTDDHGADRRRGPREGARGRSPTGRRSSASRPAT